MRALRPVRVCFVIDFLARAGTESQLLALIELARNPAYLVDTTTHRIEPVLDAATPETPTA